jgi:hypothetical protein
VTPRQRILQIKPAGAGHPHIQKHAAWLIAWIGKKKLACRRVSTDPVTGDLQQPRQGCANGSVVVDDMND